MSDRPDGEKQINARIAYSKFWQSKIYRITLVKIRRTLSMSFSSHLVRIIFLILLALLIQFPVRSAVSSNSKPEKKLKVFILAGQSNMEGRADANNLLPDDLQRLSKTQKNVQLAFNREPVGPLKAVKASPEIAEIYNREFIFGPELFFGISLSEAWPDSNILLIKLSRGSTSLHGSWHPDWSEDKATVMGEEDETRLYSSLIDYIERTLSRFKNYEYEICAILWVQGESDSGNEIAAEEYGRNLENFISSIRQDLRIDSLPFLFFQVGHGKVVEGMKKVAEVVPDVILIPQSLEPKSKDFYQKMENGHYNYEGMKKLGLKFAEVFLNQLPFYK